MLNLGFKYLTLVTFMMMVFVNFIACGAQMYQVSLEDDISPTAAADGSSTDPESPAFGLHAVNGWVELPIVFQVGNLEVEQRRALAAAMTTWEMATGRKLFQFRGIHRNNETKQPMSGDDFPDLYSVLNDKVNGHYFDFLDWAKTGKSKQVLATTVWENDGGDASMIATADIRYNGEHYIIGDALKAFSDGQREVVDMHSLALHEVGHLLGLAHVAYEHDPYSIMNPTLYIGEGLTNRMISRGDIERIQRIYGCGLKDCDVEKILQDIQRLTTIGENTAIEQLKAQNLDGSEEDGDSDGEI